MAQFSRYSWVALPHESTSSIETETYASTELHPHEYKKNLTMHENWPPLISMIAQLYSRAYIKATSWWLGIFVWVTISVFCLKKWIKFSAYFKDNYFSSSKCKEHVNLSFKKIIALLINSSIRISWIATYMYVLQWQINVKNDYYV